MASAADSLDRNAGLSPRDLLRWVIPVRMKTVVAHFHADRRLAFEVLTAFGNSLPDGSSSRIVEDLGDRKLVEFQTITPALFGRTRRYRTVELVTLVQPEEIRFDGQEGPLDLLRDRFLLEKAGDCTWFRYESTVGVKGWLAGLLISRLYVQPLLGRFMRTHTRKLKAIIEERASKSHVYPQRICSCAAPTRFA